VFKVFNESTSQAYNNTIANNTVVFNLKVLNTSFNLAGLSTPALPEGTLGISISGDVDDTEIFGNSFSVVNPASLPVGVIGVMSTNGSANTVIRENTFAGLQSAVSITDATGLSIYRNAITDSTYKAVSVLFSDLVQIYNNSISAASPTYGPSQFESGVEVVDTLLSGPIVQYNNISGYHSGIFLLGADSSKVLDNNVTSASFGVFSVGGLSVNVTNLTVDSTVEVGVKFLFTNSSFVMNSTLGSSNSGVEFYMSNSNSLNGSTIGSASVGMLFDLSSSSNSVGDNVFPGNPNDVVCDMFSSTNTGTGNGGPSVVEENGASGCTIT
jgi:nitrous oxidase accessory protein NosD